MATRLDEKWVAIEGYPNYLVSSYGRVMNQQRGRDLTPHIDKNGHLRVALYHKGLRRDFAVNRLVAEAFFLNYAEGREVLHINGNHQDNSVLNLTLGKGCRTRES